MKVSFMQKFPSKVKLGLWIETVEENDKQNSTEQKKSKRDIWIQIQQDPTAELPTSIKISKTYFYFNLQLGW